MPLLCHTLWATALPGGVRVAPVNSRLLVRSAKAEVKRKALGLFVPTKVLRLNRPLCIFGTGYLHRRGKLLYRPSYSSPSCFPLSNCASFIVKPTFVSLSGMPAAYDLSTVIGSGQPASHNNLIPLGMNHTSPCALNIP